VRAELMRRHVVLGSVGTASGVGLGLTLAQFGRASLGAAVRLDATAIGVAVAAPLLVVVLVGSVPASRLVRADLLERLRREQL
jgi:ABC-type antimicrobial peptide transport system permease subunit